MPKKKAQRKAADNRKQIEIEQRREIVAANILAGNTYVTIGKALDISPATVCSDFKAILAQWRENYAYTIDEWIAVQLRRLDVLINSIWDKSKEGDLAAMDRVMRLMERQRRLLGLDAPIRQEISGNGGAALPAAHLRGA